MSRPIFLNLPFIPFIVDVRLYGEENPSGIESAILSLIHAHGDDGLTISDFHKAIPLGRRATNELLNAMWRRAFVTISHDDARIRLERRSALLAKDDFRGLGSSVDPISYELGYDLMTGMVFNPYRLINEEPDFRFVVSADEGGEYDMPLDGFKHVPVPELLRVLLGIREFRTNRETSEITLETRLPEYQITHDHVRHYKAHFRIEKTTDEFLVFQKLEQNGSLDPILTEIAGKLPLGAAAPGTVLHATLREQASAAPPRTDQASGLMAQLRRSQERLKVIAQNPRSHHTEFESLWQSVLTSFNALIEEERFAESTRVRTQYVPKGMVEAKFIDLLKQPASRLLLASRSTYRIDTGADNSVKEMLRDALGGKDPRIDRAYLHWQTFNEDNDRRARSMRLDLEITDRLQEVENSTAQQRFRFLGASRQGNHMAASLALLDDREILLSSSALVGDMTDRATGLHVETIRDSVEGQRSGFHPVAVALNNRLTKIFSMGSLFPARQRARDGEPMDAQRFEALQKIAEGLLDRIPDAAALWSNDRQGSQDTDEPDAPDVGALDPDALKQFWLLCAEALQSALDQILELRAEGPLVAKTLFEAEIYFYARDLILSARANSEITICVCPAAEMLRSKPPLHEPFPEIDAIFLDPLRLFLEQSENSSANLVIMASEGSGDAKYKSFLRQIESIAEVFPNRLNVIFPSAENNELTANTGLSCVLTEDATLIASGGVLGAQIRTRNSGIRSHVGFLLRGQGHAHAALQQLNDCVPKLRVTLNRQVMVTDAIAPARRAYLAWMQEIRKLYCKDLGLSALDGIEPRAINEIANPLFQRVAYKKIALTHGPDTDIGNRARTLLFRMAEDEGDLSAMAAFAEWAPYNHSLRQDRLRDGIITFLMQEPFPPASSGLVKEPEGAALLVLSWLEDPSNSEDLLIQAFNDSNTDFSSDLAPILTNLAHRASLGHRQLPDLARMNDPSQDEAKREWEEQFDTLCENFDLISRKDYGTTSARKIRSLAFWEDDELTEFSRIFALLQNSELSMEKKAKSIHSELRKCTPDPARTFRSKETAQRYALERVADFNAQLDEELVGARRAALANDWARLLADCQAWVSIGQMLELSSLATPLDKDLFASIGTWLDEFNMDKGPEDGQLQILLHTRLTAMAQEGQTPKDMRVFFRYPTAFDVELHPEQSTNWSEFQNAILEEEWRTGEEFLIPNFESQLNAAEASTSRSWLGRCKRMLSKLTEPDLRVVRNELVVRFDQFVDGEARRLLDKVDTLERTLSDLGGDLSEAQAEKRQIIKDLEREAADADSVELASIYFFEIERDADAQRDALRKSLDMEIEKLEGDAYKAARALQKMGDLRGARVATKLSWPNDRQWPVSHYEAEFIKVLFGERAMNRDSVAALEIHLKMEGGSIRNGKRTQALCEVLEAKHGITEEVATDFTEMVAAWFDPAGSGACAEMSKAIQQKLELAQLPSILCRQNITDDPPPVVVWKGGENWSGLLIDPSVTQDLLEVSALTLGLEDILPALAMPFSDRPQFILRRLEKRARFSALFAGVDPRNLPCWAARTTTPQTLEQDAAAILAVAQRFGCRIAFEYEVKTDVRLPPQAGFENEIMGLCRILSEWDRRGLDLWSVLSDCFMDRQGDRLFEARRLS